MFYKYKYRFCCLPCFNVELHSSIIVIALMRQHDFIFFFIHVLGTMFIRETNIFLNLYVFEIICQLPYIIYYHLSPYNDRFRMCEFRFRLNIKLSWALHLAGHHLFWLNCYLLSFSRRTRTNASANHRSSQIRGGGCPGFHLARDARNVTIFNFLSFRLRIQSHCAACPRLERARRSTTGALQAVIRCGCH